MTIPMLRLDNATDRQQVEAILRKLRLDPADLALSRGDRARQNAAVLEILSDVANRGDEAVVELSRKFDDPNFTAEQIRVKPDEMRDAAARVTPDQTAALQRSIAQVQEYQSHVMPKEPPTLRRPGVELGMRFTPL